MDGGTDDRMVTQTEAAVALGISKATVSRDLKKFKIEPDNHGLFSLKAYTEARRTDLNPMMARTPSQQADVPQSENEGLNAASARLKAIQADQAQIELDKEKGLIVYRADVEQTLSEASRALRDSLLGIPARAAPELAAVNDPAEIERALGRIIRESLEALARSFASLAAAPETKAA